MKSVIVVRSSPDYKKMDQKSFGFQINHPYKPHTEIKKVIEANVLEIWKSFFSLDFFEYRHEMALIAKKNIEASGCLIITAKELPFFLKDNSDYLIVPVDDDDWFSPDVSNIDLEECFDMMCWNKTTYKNFNTMKFYENYGFRLGSNNWCVRKSWLKSLDLETAKKFILGSHRHAETYVKENVSTERIKITDDKISVHLRHIGSLAMLRALANDNLLESTFQEISERHPTMPIFPDYFHWTQPYVKMSQELAIKMKRKLIC